ncbi:hypothetical protein OH687_19600 [Burkholderia anthina]|nr:hypothetical protein OH687_19600 [Burkholderia anthina]
MDVAALFFAPAGGARRMALARRLPGRSTGYPAAGIIGLPLFPMDRRRTCRACR